MLRLFFFVLLSMPLLLSGQKDFIAPIILTDASGRVDTIIIGIQSDATQGVDSIYGESYLSHSLIDSNFAFFTSIREANLFNYAKPFVLPDLISKKNIVPIANTPTGKRQFFYTYVLTNNPPIKLQWDSSRFFEYNASFVVSSHPGGWFDVGDQPVFLSQKGNCTKLGLKSHFILDSTVFGTSKKFFILYFGIHSLPEVSISSFEYDEMKIYPNPINQRKLKIEGNEVANISITNSIGVLIYSSDESMKEYSIDFENYPKNVYFLRIETKLKTKFYKLLN
jgi:hypothetical protein